MGLGLLLISEGELRDGTPIQSRIGLVEFAGAIRLFRRLAGRGPVAASAQRLEVVGSSCRIRRLIVALAIVTGAASFLAACALLSSAIRAAWCRRLVVGLVQGWAYYVVAGAS